MANNITDAEIGAMFVAHEREFRDAFARASSASSYANLVQHLFVTPDGRMLDWGRIEQYSREVFNELLDPGGDLGWRLGGGARRGER